MTRRYSTDIIADTPAGAVSVVVVSSAGARPRLVCVQIAKNAKSALAAAARAVAADAKAFPPAPGEKVAVQRARTAAGNDIRRYFAGRSRSFGVPNEIERATPFKKKILRACARIPFGKTVTYGELAAAAGAPRAARAAGRAIGANPFPIIVPCHRVVGASGLGGYSAEAGIKAKKALLDFEKSR